MNTVDLVALPSIKPKVQVPDKRNLWLWSELVRVSILMFGLLIILLYQATQPYFIASQIWQPIYFFFALSFLGHCGLLLLIDKSPWNKFAEGVSLVFDGLWVGSLILETSMNPAVGVFVLLIYIALTGFVHGKRSALAYAVFCSVLYSATLLLSDSFDLAPTYIGLVFNNLAFGSVAFLSSHLSLQLRTLEKEVVFRGRSIEALKELNQMIVDNVTTGILTIDNNRYITHANQSALKIFEAATLRGERLDELLEETAEKIHTGDISKFGSANNRFEVDYYRLDNEKLILEVVVSPLKKVEGEFAGWVLMLQDLTQIKRFEYAMRQQEKLAAVGQLAAGIAHEIRNPLASISGSIQLLSTSLKATTPEDTKLLNIVLKEIDRLNLLITEFLDYVKPEIVPDEPVNLNTMVMGILEMVKHNKGLNENVDQVAELEAKKIILGHPDKLKQAILNIVINAYQAMDESSTGAVRIATYDRDNSVVLLVSDKGVGIEAEQITKIFEPFHTTKPKGTGLGLAITHKILESHGATVFVESEPGQGTTFTIEFPAADTHLPDEMFERKRA